MKKSNIIFAVLVVVGVIAVYFLLVSADTDTTSEAVVNTEASQAVQTESDTKATDYNSSRSNRTVADSIGIDEDCDDTTDCERLDADSDGDGVPADGSASGAQSDGYIQLGDVKGEARDN